MLTDSQRRARLILQGRLNNTEIANLTNCVRNTVRSWRKRLKELELSLNDLEELDDLEIRKLVTPEAFNREHEFETPDWVSVLFERDERGVTPMTLFGEYEDGISAAMHKISLCGRSLQAAAGRQRC